MFLEDEPKIPFGNISRVETINKSAPKIDIEIISVFDPSFHFNLSF